MVASQNISYAFLIGRAWPIILANAAVPLLGLVDTAVIGNVGSITDLGAIAFGALIFSFVYWSFGFLRMGTTGFVAREAGAENGAGVRAALGRALLIAVALGGVLILLQIPIRWLALQLLDGSLQVESAAAEYFNIRIWGAPATLANFVVMGVFIGLGESRLLLWSQLFLNGTNMLFDILFAAVMGWGVEGIAFGTICAEWTSLLFAGYLIHKALAPTVAENMPFWPLSLIADRKAMWDTLNANTDIMVRTLILVFSFAWFTNLSARFGDVVLAANHILLQLISFSAFFLDGYAVVAESLVGRAVGSGDQRRFDEAIGKSTMLAFITAIGLALLIWLLGDLAVQGLTDIAEVRDAATGMLLLAAVYVLLSFPAFQMDGVFIGASRTRQMRNAAFWSVSVFMLACWLLVEQFGVNGLWWAMIIYVIARAVALGLYLPELRTAIKVR